MIIILGAHGLIFSIILVTLEKLMAKLKQPPQSFPLCGTYKLI